MKRFALLVGVVLAVGVSLVGMALTAEGPIKVGIVLPLTGEQAKFGEIESNSFQMAAEEINKAGGVNGRTIELLIEDDKGRPDVGRSAAEKLISRDQVSVLTGGYFSPVAHAICAVAQQRQVPFVVTTASADKITEQGWDYVFRVCPPVSEYPRELNSFLGEVVKPKTVAILYANTPVGQSGAKEFAKECEYAGIKVLLREGYEQGALDFRPLLIKVKAARPDFIYMISSVVDAVLLMRQSKELDLSPKLFVGGTAAFTLPEFAKDAGDAAENVLSAALWSELVPYPGAKTYHDKYLEKFKTPTEYRGAEAYASMYVVADALKRAKELTPKGIREALATTDMMTVFGPVKFTAYGRKKQQNSLPTYLVQWQKGVLETVWPQNVASKPYVYPIPAWSK